MMVRLVSYPLNPDKLCGTAAAMCYDGDDWTKSLAHSAGSGHESVIEHATFTFEIFNVSRVLLAQLTRHRIASFSVKSQRYCKLDGGYIEPDKIADSDFRAEFENLHKEAYDLYQRMVDAGIPKEDARYVIPQSATTDITMTMNARELKHFFFLRCCNRAQWEIRKMADEMYRLVYPIAPLIFDKAGPGCVCGGCKEKRPCGHPRSLEEWHGKN